MAVPVALLREPIWHRQLGERARQWNAFRFYRDMGQARTVLDAYRQDTGKPDATQANGTWNAWVSRWRWVERAIAWDNHLDTQQRAAQEAAARKDGERLAELRRKQADTELEMGQKLLDKANQMLTLPIVQVVNQVDPATGVAMQTIEPGKWSFRDAARFVEVAVQLRRLALGMDTSRAAVRIDIEDEVRQLARQHGWDEEAAVRAATAFADGHGDRAVLG